MAVVKARGLRFIYPRSHLSPVSAGHEITFPVLQVRSLWSRLGNTLRTLSNVTKPRPKEAVQLNTLTYASWYRAAFLLHNECIALLQIRDLPEPLYRKLVTLDRTLKKEAKRAGIRVA